MAAVTKSTKGVSLATTLPPAANKINGLVASEAIATGDACKVTASGVARAMGSDVVDGFALSPAGVGEPITLFHGVVARYGDGLTPGTSLYLSASVPGGLDTTVAGSIVGRVLDSSRVLLKASY